MDDVVLIVRFRAKPGREADLEQVLAEAVAGAHAGDPGVIRFVLHRVLDEPREFVLYEWFRSRQALDERRQRPETLAMRAALQDIRESAEEVLVAPVAGSAWDLARPEPEASRGAP